LSRGGRPGKNFPARSYVKQEIDDVPVFHDVIPSLLQQFSRLADFLLIPQLDEVLVFDDLGPDESLLQVGMDNPSGLGSEGMLPVGPGPDFVGADGEERDEPV